MSEPSGAGAHSGADLDGLLTLERQHLQKKAPPTPQGAPPDGGTPPEGPSPDSPGYSLCGLALSGGGIRSATFNLGLLQGLQQMGLLGMFDYVATVSGGGYIGGFWTAWRHYARLRPQAGNGKPEAGKDKSGLFPMNEQNPRVTETGARGSHLPEVRHLREFSNFLNPRLGLLSGDTGRLIAAVSSALVPALLAALSLLLLILLGWGVVAQLLLTGWPRFEQDFCALPVQWAQRLGPCGPMLRSCGLMFLMTCGGLLLFEWLGSRRDARVKRARAPAKKPSTFVHYLSVVLGVTGLLSDWLGSRREERARPRDTSAPEPGTPRRQKPQTLVTYLSVTLLMTIIVLLSWLWLRDRLHVNAWYYEGVWMYGREEGDLRLGERLYVFTPALAWLGASGVLVLLRWFGSRFVTEQIRQPEQAAVDRVLSRLLALATFWSLISTFWLAGRLLREYALMHPGLEGTYALLRTGLVGAVLGLMAMFAKVQQLFGRKTSAPVSPTMKSRAKSYLPQLLAYAVLSLILLGLVLLLLRARDEGWLPGLAGVAGAITGVTVLLFNPNIVGLHGFYRSRIARTFIGAAHGEAGGQTEPHEKDDLRLDELDPGPRPLHLVCCAANDLASEDPMANLYRGADSAVLSPVGFSVGNDWSTWERFQKTGAPVPTFASVLTASGAAFNSHMGALSMRLGPAVTFLMTTLNLRLGLWLPHPTRARKGWFSKLLESVGVGLPFYKELLGLSRVRSRNVLLSDGGHFENLALYELVRRHCRFILVSDCGMDSNTAFDDFANAVRRVRDDFGVEIRIDLSPLRAEQDKPARQSVVAGDIEYPNGDTGVLLLVKPTLLGTEPADITQYKARNADFPHESTGDQFYDEAQWEAYRRLGEHAALTAFRPVQGKDDPEGRVETAQLFARARYEWLPVASGYKERFSTIVDRAASLDLMLRDQGARRLFREIYKELYELDEAAIQAGARRGGNERKPEDLPDSEAPSTQELSDALHMIRRALLFMEEVFLTENLATYYHHPAYLGIINYFARWAYAPLLRTWWPLLKTLYSPRFTHFFEERFSLPAMEREEVGRLSKRERGFAMSCWTEQGGQHPGPEEKLISYELDLPYGRKPRYHIQAAQLIVRTHYKGECSERERSLRWKDKQALVWQGDDFYVPPGLWGAGIGEDFLRLLTSGPDMMTHAHVERGSLLAVRLLVNRDAPTARRKRWADDVQLYRSHGFLEPEPGSELSKWLSEVNEDLKIAPPLSWKGKHGEKWQEYWLVRRFDPVQKTETQHRGSSDQEATYQHEESGDEGPAVQH